MKAAREQQWSPSLEAVFSTENLFLFGVPDAKKKLLQIATYLPKFAMMARSVRQLHVALVIHIGSQCTEERKDHNAVPVIFPSNTRNFNRSPCCVDQR